MGYCQIIIHNARFEKYPSFYDVKIFEGNLESSKTIKVAYTSGPIFEKIMKRYPICSVQIINYQIDQTHK